MPCIAWIWFLQVNQWLTWLEQAEEDSDEEDWRIRSMALPVFQPNK